MDELLKKMGLKREDLNAEELDTLKQWSASMATKQVGVKDVQDYIEGMIRGVEKELAGYDYPQNFTALLFRGRRERALKARLYNYLMLRDFITAPERAKVFIDKQIAVLAQKKG